MGLIGVSGKKQSGKDTIAKIIQGFEIYVKHEELKESYKVSNLFVLDYITNKQSIYVSSFVIKKFADKLKDIVCLLIGCTRAQLEDEEFKAKELGEEWWYYTRVFHGDVAQDLIPYTPNFYHKDLDKMSLIKLTPRRLLQLLGTECGRQIIHPNIWVNTLMNEYTSYADAISGTSNVRKLFPNWIITDVRFPNELNAIKAKEGIIIRVNRRKDLSEMEENTDKEHESETALDTAEFDYIINNNNCLECLIDKVKNILIREKIITL